MNRFQRGDRSLLANEKEIFAQKGVKIYDGNETTTFEKGNLILTGLRILWRDQLETININELSLSLTFIRSVEEQAKGWKKSPKIVAHLNPVDDKSCVFQSPFQFVKFSFREGGNAQFFRKLNEALEAKQWESLPTSAPKFRPGIMGIERQIQKKKDIADKNISAAFEDLSNLMEMAKDMVGMAKNICRRITDKQGDLTDDETTILKSQLLSLGISDPVTKKTHGSAFHVELSKQLSEFLYQIIQDSGGVLALTDVYCRVNRARGLQLLSPEDLLIACDLFEELNLPLVLWHYDSGVKVVQLASLNFNEACKEIDTLLNEKGSLTADELAILISTSVVLGKERLLATEKQGLACRDDSLEGLRFYPNLFLSNDNQEM